MDTINTMKILFSFLFLILSSNLMNAEEALSDIIKRLDSTIKEREDYAFAKKEKIASLQNLLKSSQLPQERIYEINRELFNQYRGYKCDSAIIYVEQNLKLATKLGYTGWMDESKLQLTSLFATIGMYKEALDILNTLNHSEFSGGMKTYYYDISKQVYKNYSYENFYGNTYKEISMLYQDSLLLQLDDKNSSYHQILYVEKLIDEEQLDEAEKILQSLYSAVKEGDSDYAYVTHCLGKIYQKRGDQQQQQRYYALSAISDIKRTQKENASLQLLARSMYETGDIDRAYEYIKCSLEDAIFCKARLRMIEISNLFPIIDSAYKHKVIKQRQQLTFYLLLTSVLTFLLILTIIYISRQMKKLSKAREALQQVNQQLNELNKQLAGSNDELFEANHIKEEYIGYFLDLCSSYIDKLENYRRTLNKKAATNKLEELFRILKSTELVETELKELYTNFDTIFLNLYPSFIQQFNELLQPDARFIMKPGELLNVELRIFALIRLGINDSYKIANFLRYSSSTIYNYRSRIKNKSIVPRDEFEKIVMEIGRIKK